jgi:signal transduction histidine kinase
MPALILNVDDYDTNRYVRTRLLQREGFRVIEAANGLDAVRLAESERPDLVILDVQLPDIDGFEVCRRLRANPVTASLLVLHVSATATDSPAMVAGLDNGADGYLTDTVDAQVVIATVRALLRLRAAEQERNAALERLRESEDQLRHANRLKDEFLATLSHELRTPMNAIVGWVHLLRQGNLAPDMAGRAIEVIARNANAQMQLINDVLDVSRIVSGKTRIELRPITLASTVRAAVESMLPTAEAKGVRLALDGESAGIVMGDPDRLQQVFWNLLSNAVKFTAAPGRVDVRMRQVPDAAVVEVADTGNGIPAWFVPHLFERFAQLDSSTHRQHTGLGLGLALVRHLVELHGGRVEATSRGEGLGSTFTVTLPLAGTVGEDAPLDAESGKG